MVNSRRRLLAAALLAGSVAVMVGSALLLSLPWFWAPVILLVLLAVTGAIARVSGGAPGEDRERERRRADRVDRAISLLIIALIFGMVIGFERYVHTRDVQRSQDLHAKSVQRTDDLRAQCRRGSRKTAVNVNLYWVYYQSEHDLTSNRRDERRFKADLALLTPGEQRFLQLLISSGQNSRTVLEARARADYAAAQTNAQTVDMRDAHLVALKTALGSGRKPRQWVNQAHYSCDQAFR